MGLTQLQGKKSFFGNNKLIVYIDRNNLPKFYGGTCNCADGLCLQNPFEVGTNNEKDEEKM
eukprot:TRINITY_DN2072_c0_g1_i1.p1 TRINITY_DN2072_c0_g1~~TRINITY_DN2072_c0_g1_i1.p1  ORF type:complete len:70 (-),score=14.91 TRINITY_DN2072_c0_g1_i1:48-230(-)